MTWATRFAPFALLPAIACGAETAPVIVDESSGADAGDDGAIRAPTDAANAGADAQLGAGDGAVETGKDGASAIVEGGVQTACTPVGMTSAPSGGAACSGTGTCFPHDETGFTTVWVPPVPQAHLCSTVQINDYFTDCTGTTATGTACAAWTQSSANSSCLSCLQTPSTASRYGVLIGFPGNVVELNVAGCVALAEPCNLPCAQTSLAIAQCREAACSTTSCPDQSEQLSCATAADACTSCEQYVTASACLTELTGPTHPAQTLCALGSNSTPTQTQYAAVAAFMCGP